MFTQEEKDHFFDAIESLKKYRRADLLDDKGKNLLELLYTDLLPNDHILKKCIRENTTFLIGRKGVVSMTSVGPFIQGENSQAITSCTE